MSSHSKNAKNMLDKYLELDLFFFLLDEISLEDQRWWLLLRRYYLDMSAPSEEPEEAAGYEKCGSLSSPRVSGSGQTDPEVEAEVSSRTGGIKAESEEKKPVVKDSEANTVKSGKK